MSSASAAIRRFLTSQPGLALLQLALAGGLASLWAAKLNWRLLHLGLHVHDSLWLAAVPALGITATLLRALRLRLVVAPHVRVGCGRAFWITAASKLAAALAPIGAGEALRLFWLRRWCRLSMGTGGAAIVNDRVLHLLGAVVLLGGLAGGSWLVYAGDARAWTVTAAAAGTAALLALMAIGALVLPHVLRSGRELSWLPASGRWWLLAQSRHFQAAALHRLGGRRFAAGVSLSMGAFMADAFMLMSLFASLGMKLPIVPSLTVNLMLVPGGVVPSPGGLGVVELVGTIGIHPGSGVQMASAAAGVLAWHAAGIAVTLAVGAIAIAILGLPRRQQARGPLPPRSYAS